MTSFDQTAQQLAAARRIVREARDSGTITSEQYSAFVSEVGEEPRPPRTVTITVPVEGDDSALRSVQQHARRVTEVLRPLASQAGLRLAGNVTLSASTG